MRVALVTCREVAGLDSDDRLVMQPLAERGVRVEPAAWDAPDVDWSAYDLAILRSTWDYPRRREHFVAWARSVPALANPPDVIAWNTDKRYLADLAAADLPVVPTTWVAAGAAWPIPDRGQPDPGQYVIKPTVGAGSLDTARYDLRNVADRGLARDHVERLQRAGRDVMVQPYLSGVDTFGETALLFLGGRYSHAVRKGPMLDADDQSEHSLYRPEQISPREPSALELSIAERALAAVPGGVDRLLYARVDVIPGPDGNPVLLELELTEPSLFLGHATGAPERFADAIVHWLRDGTVSR